MTSAGTRVPRPWLRLVGLGLVMMSLTAGCGSDSASDAGSVSPSGAGGGSGALQIHYDYVYEVEGSEGRVVIDVIVLGADKSRSRMAWYFDGEAEADETFLTVRDGNRALLHNEAAEPEYTVLEAADEHPDEFFLIVGPLQPGSPEFQETCPGAKPRGKRTILGRDAVGYACNPSDPDPNTQPAEIWLDEATGLVLEFGVIKALEVTVDPVIDETTFSTTPPAGADVEVIKATGKGAPSPSGSESEQPELSPEDTLSEIAVTSPIPIYYLGPAFEGVPMSEVFIMANGSESNGDLRLDAGETVHIRYGEVVTVSTEPFDPRRYRYAAGCERLDPVRGVPTVAQSDAVWLFTADLVIRLGNLAYTAEMIAPAGAALVVAGHGPTSEDLPAPPARNVTLVDKACGANPGETGPPIED